MSIADEEEGRRMQSGGYYDAIARQRDEREAENEQIATLKARCAEVERERDKKQKAYSMMAELETRMEIERDEARKQCEELEKTLMEMHGEEAALECGAAKAVKKLLDKAEARAKQLEQEATCEHCDEDSALMADGSLKPRVCLTCWNTYFTKAEALNTRYKKALEELEARFRCLEDTHPTPCCIRCAHHGDEEFAIRTGHYCIRHEYHNDPKSGCTCVAFKLPDNTTALEDSEGRE